VVKGIGKHRPSSWGGSSPKMFFSESSRIFLIAPRSLEEVTEHLLRTVREGADETLLRREVEAYFYWAPRPRSPVNR